MLESSSNLFKGKESLRKASSLLNKIANLTDF